MQILSINQDDSVIIFVGPRFSFFFGVFLGGGGGGVGGGGGEN
jgi:hypothetical protein